MIYSNKSCIQRISPYDLFLYIDKVMTEWKIPLTSIRINQYDIRLNKPLYDFPISLVSFFEKIGKEEELQTEVQLYLENIQSQFFEIVAESDLLLALYGCNTMSHILDSIDYLVRRKFIMPVSLEEIRKQLKTFVKNTVLSKEREEMSAYYLGRQSIAFSPYTPLTFSNPGRILTIYQEYIELVEEKYATFHDFFIFCTFYQQPFHLIKNDELDWIKRNRRIIAIEPGHIRSNLANIKTIQWISNELYPTEIETIQNKYGCVAPRLIEVYRNLASLSSYV
jgi:hypothetical protein